MKIIDLTHTITSNMPVYPGTKGPEFHPVNCYETHGFKETLLSFYTHTGTHMDPPAHILPHGITLDEFPISQFIGQALKVDCSHLAEGNQITMADIKKVEKKAREAEFIIFQTGWDRYWGEEKYFGNYPYINEEVANFLITTNKKGVGLDTISVDPIWDSTLTLHKKLFTNHQMVIIENLTNLHLLGEEIFTFCALPLKVLDSDGSPVRAVAMVEEE